MNNSLEGEALRLQNHSRRNVRAHNRKKKRSSEMNLGNLILSMDRARASFYELLNHFIQAPQSQKTSVPPVEQTKYQRRRVSINGNGNNGNPGSR
ncbi:hypothetical protein Nepgr_012978 [Nepenthes gracilis]|uniref:Uncharacterized protein n=1 Tax=Nepenthes gracilis TaxID=150966 RepID=A0AAD3SH48_NEPGR|nr:hypothetical protein Nepgr_012978 [Nepenthes gracilis]